MAKKQKSDQSRSPQKCYCLLPICVLVNAIKEIRSQSFNFTTTTFSIIPSFKRPLFQFECSLMKAFDEDKKRVKIDCRENIKDWFDWTPKLS